jgi:arginine deiminase
MMDIVIEDLREDRTTILVPKKLFYDYKEYLRKYKTGHLRISVALATQLILRYAINKDLLSDLSEQAAKLRLDKIKHRLETNRRISEYLGMTDNEYMQSVRHKRISKIFKEADKIL